MKRSAIFFVLLTFAWLISAVAFINQKNKLPEKNLEIVFRNIGHQLLLHAKDSTSRVLPVKKTDENTYQISFQNNFVFIPDTLVNLVHRELEKYHLPNEYIVNVKDCAQQGTVFAYEISDRTGNLIPCTGRKQEAGCYVIEIEFLKTDKFDFSLLLMLSIPLIVAGFYLKKTFWKKENIEPIADNNNFIHLGKYQFSADKNVLIFENEITKLSEKETKSLQIFAGNRNQIVERERLMKEIWEDDGVFVISRNVDVLVSKLRKKLSEDESIKIINVHGKGYKLIVE